VLTSALGVCVCPRGDRRRMAWVAAAVIGALVITAIAVGAPRASEAGVLEQRTIQDAFPVPKSALRQYLEHTGGSSKLARLNPSMASRIEGEGEKVARSKGGVESRLQALHLHQMVRPMPPCPVSGRLLTLALFCQARAKVRNDRRAALNELDTGADLWSSGNSHASGAPSAGPKAQLSVATAADLAAMAQAADPSRTQGSTSLQAKVEAGNKAWAKLQELHEQGSRGRTANRKQWVPPPGAPAMAEPPLIYDTPTAARQQEWETGRAAISRQFFEKPGAQYAQQAIKPQAVKGPLMASVPGQSAQYFESPGLEEAGAPVAQVRSGPMMSSVDTSSPQFFETPSGQVVEEAGAPVAQVQSGPMMSSVDTSSPQFFETPSGQVVEMAPPQQLQQQQQAQSPRFFETPSGAVVEVENGVMRQVGGAALASPKAAQMHVVPSSQSTKLSEDTDDLDGSMGVVHSEPLEDATMAPENQYTVEGTSFPTQVTVMSPNTYLPVAQGQQAAMVGGVPTGYGDVTTPTAPQMQQMAQQPQEDTDAAQTQSLYGMGGRDDPMEGVYKFGMKVQPIPCDGPIKHSDTPLCVAKKAMAQALQAEKDVIAAHEKIAQQKDRISRLDQSYHEHYEAMQLKFEALVKSLRARIADQKRRLLAETRRITTGDNVSLQKVAQARETEMRDWQALNRRLNQVARPFRGGMPHPRLTSPPQIRPPRRACVRAS